LANEKQAACFFRQNGKGSNLVERAKHRRCGTSRYIFHLVRQSILWNSELEDKGSCSSQTGASFQNSSVANWCQKSQKSIMAGLLNHTQEGRTSGRNGEFPNSLVCFHEVISHTGFIFFWPQSKISMFNANARGSFKGTWQLVEALALSRRSRARFPWLSLEVFIRINLPAALWPWDRLSLSL